MPTFNFRPILFPRARKTADYYRIMSDMRDIELRQEALDQGGEIYSPAGWDKAIADTAAILRNPYITDRERRKAQADLIDFQIKKLRTQLARRKDIDTTDLKQLIEQDLRFIQFETPQDPYHYATMAQIKYGDVLYGTALGEDVNNVYDLLEIFKRHHIDTSALEDLIRDFEMEEFKYAEINRGFEELGSMDEKVRARGARRLGEYAVVYTPYMGKVKNMRIVSKADKQISHMKPTNLKFTIVPDAEGNPVLGTGDDLVEGLSTYFIRANAMFGDKYNFAGVDFEYDGERFTGDVDNFSYQNIRHASIHEINPGTFVENDRGEFYYVNQDMTFTSIKSDKWKNELGFQEDKVYQLSPDEQLNTLAGAVTPFKEFIRERFSRENETEQFNFWNAFGRELLGTPRRMREWQRRGVERWAEERKMPREQRLRMLEERLEGQKGIGEWIGGIGERIGEWIGGISERERRRMKEIDAKYGRMKEKKPIITGIPSDIMTEESKKFIKGLPIERLPKF
ncbi:MAG: hypothetical protein LRZ94_00830 [Candidatus Pacebacteria bacterium]|nr:hypothetical protein [Candidatus Paceibacterota bacterium]